MNWKVARASTAYQSWQLCEDITRYWSLYSRLSKGVRLYKIHSYQRSYCRSVCSTILYVTFDFGMILVTLLTAI